MNPTDVHELIAGALAGLVPEPPPVADLADRVGARVRRRRRTQLQGLVSGVVVLAVLIAVPLTLGLGSRRPDVAQPAPVFTGPGGRAAAVAQVAAMFAALSLPPHAVALSGPPASIAEQLPPPLSNGNAYLVSTTRWWTVPSPLTGLSAWLQGHAPAGSTAQLLGTASDHGVATMTMISYDWPTSQASWSTRRSTSTCTRSGRIPSCRSRET